MFTKEYVDLDTKIEEHIQLSIAEYFTITVKSFRKVESDILRKLSNEDKLSRLVEGLSKVQKIGVLKHSRLFFT